MNTPAPLLEVEACVKKTINAYMNNHKYEADQLAEELIDAIKDSFEHFHLAQDWWFITMIGLSLGRYLEGDHYNTWDEDEKAEQEMVVGLTQYCLTKVIKGDTQGERYLAFSDDWHCYRFSTGWEYNKTMAKLLSHATGKDYETSDYSDITSQISRSSLLQAVQCMYLSDGLEEPKVLGKDPNLRRIFNEEIIEYQRSSWPNILKEGKRHYDLLYNYLLKKIELGESDF